MLTPSPSSGKRPELSSPKTASSPFKMDPATPKSSSHHHSSPRDGSGSSLKSRKKPKYTPQSNTLFNYLSPLSGSPSSKNNTCGGSSGSDHRSILAGDTSPLSSHHRHAQQENAKDHQRGHSSQNLRNPDKEEEHHHHHKSWQSSSSSHAGARSYPAGQLSRSPTSSWANRHRRYSACDEGPEEGTPIRSDKHSTSSQPLPDRTNTSPLRYRRFSGGSSEKKFPIIRPLRQHGPSYDDILSMAKQNVDKQRNERHHHHHKSGHGSSSPGKYHGHSHDSDHSSAYYSSSDGERLKPHPKHRHSSGSDKRSIIERHSPSKVRHLSGSDRDIQIASGLDRHLFRNLMKRSPVVKVIKINTASPVKITEELLKRCGSPVVLSDSGLSSAAVRGVHRGLSGSQPVHSDSGVANQSKDDLKRHHSADDLEDGK